MKSIALNRDGTSSVEFAILTPLFLLFLFGMVAYGIYFGASHSIQQIAADAARTAVAGLSPSERRTLASDYIARNAGDYPFVDPHKLSLTIRDSPSDADEFSVSIRYDARDLPIWSLLDSLPLPDMTIARSSTIRIGGM